MTRVSAQVLHHVKVMWNHNDFRSSAETQVKSPQHLKLDTRLLRHRDRQLFYNMYEKGNDPLNWGLTEAVPPNP